MKPVRRITNEDDLAKFIESDTREEVIDFVVALNNSVVGREIGLSEPVSRSIHALLGLLDKVVKVLHNNPSKDSESRFGKPEFANFYDELADKAPEWLREAVKGTTAEALDDQDGVIEELATYFGESFGNRTRLDYGSGHELNFVCFLLCLHKLGLLEPEDYANVVLGVFAKYFQVMRLLQQEYWLEPAGSHGVWGLDDYHFLPFLFGSGQLVKHKYLRPISIHDADIVDMYKDKYFYFGCIHFINSVKTASLRWHSPMLDDISGVKQWSKVNEGMIKMYKAEVLGKLPIVQHFLFGSLLPAPEGVTKAQDVTEVHMHCWADCCGIRIPSAVAANASGKGKGHTLQKPTGMPLD